MLRRTFVELTSMAFAGSMVSFVGCTSSPTHLERILSLPSALAAIHNPETIAALGESYRISVPDEDNLEQLRNMLLLDVKDNVIAEDTDDATLKQLLEERVKSDFDQGETVILDGWILSKTEARQCALFSLTQTID